MTAVDGADAAAGFLSAWVNAFTAFDEAHGFAVNLFAVVALAVIGAAFLTRPAAAGPPGGHRVHVLCVADWVLIEDFGFFGGLGTDPNSMIPFALLAVGGYLALRPRAPSRGCGAGDGSGPAAPQVAAAGWRDRLRPASVRRSVGDGELRHGRVARRARADHPRRGTDGRRPGQPGRGPDPRRGHRRVEPRR